MRSKSPDMPDAIAGGGDKAGNGDRRDGAAEEHGAELERQPPKLGAKPRSNVTVKKKAPSVWPRAWSGEQKKKDRR